MFSFIHLYFIILTFYLAHIKHLKLIARCLQYLCLYRKTFFFFVTSQKNTERRLSENRFTLNRFGEACNNGVKRQHIYFWEHPEQDRGFGKLVWCSRQKMKGCCLLCFVTLSAVIEKNGLKSDNICCL